MPLLRIYQTLPQQKLRAIMISIKIRTGDYRIIYEIHDDTLVILVAKIGHRKDVYKRLK